MKKVYLEITNICNLSCSFCHKTDREKRFLTAEEYALLTDRLLGKTEYLYFHLMGEPLLHPQLPDFIRTAKEKGFKPCLTTNGTLLKDRGSAIADSGLYRISISLHAPEANGAFATPEYLQSCVDFAKKASSSGSFVALRLWNEGGREAGNPEILQTLRESFPGEWVPTRSGWRMADRIFLEKGEIFDWPDFSAPVYEGEIFCYGLRDQIGVLSDGSVVPCCLDADGAVVLGNLFRQTMEEILSTSRAKAIYDGFTRHEASEELCRHCGYAAMKKRH